MGHGVGLGLKLSLLIVVLLVPLLATTVALVIELQNQLRVATGTRHGLEYVAALRSVLEPLTAHRGSTTLALGGDVAAVETSRGLERKVDAAMVKLREASDAYRANAAFARRVESIASNWAMLESSWPGLTVERDRILHTSLAEEFLALNEEIGDASLFPVDAVAQSHYLLDALELRLLPAASLIGWTRSELAAGAARGSLAGSQRDQLLQVAEQLRSLNRLLEADIRKAAATADPRIRPLESVYAAYRTEWLGFERLSDEILSVTSIHVQPTEIMRRGAVAKQSALALYDATHAVVSQIIDARIAAAYRRAAATFGIVLLLTCLAILIAVRVRGQTVRQLAAARSAFDRIEAGRFDSVLVPESRDEAGQVVASLARMQVALGKRVERDAILAAVAEKTDGAVIVTDLDGAITWVNGGFERMTGYPAATALGQQLERLLQRNSADPGACEAIAAARTARRSWKIDAHSIGADGRRYIAQAESQPIADPDGKVRGHIVLETEITDRVRLTDELRSARDEAEAANRAKSTFLANMSHEIRTPLNGVIGMTGLLLDTSLDAQQREFAEIAQSSGEGLLTLLNDILDFSKIEAGFLEFESIDFDLIATLEDSADSVVLRAEQKGVAVLIDIDPSVPSHVRGDPGRFRQVLLNLVSNAVKFTEQGEVRLAARAFVQMGHPVVDVEVRDSGLGMDAMQLARLFSPFSQADSSMARRFGGTGLGLAISKRLVDGLGGQIAVSSIPGVGSTFKVTIPFRAATARAAVRTATSLAGRHVLIVEDHPVNRRIVESQLTSAGCRVSMAETAHQGLSMWTRLRDAGAAPDAALLDHDLPDQSGTWLAEQLRQSAGSAAPGLVLLTSLGGLVQQQALASGCSRVLTKPVKRRALLDAIAESIGQSTQSAAPSAEASPVTQLDGLRVLVAEDNVVNQKVIGKLLERMGVAVRIANDGAEAVSVLREFGADIVLMDCQMPNVDGYEATKRIRSGAAGAQYVRMPVIAVTAHALAGERDRCLLAGMDDCLTKPIEPDKLRAALTQYHARQQGASRTAQSLGAAEGASAWSPTYLLDKVGGDRGFVVELLTTFLEVAQAQVRQLMEQTGSGAARLAHSLKGAAASLGATELMRCAAEFEASAREGTATDVEALTRAWRGTEVAIRAYLAEGVDAIERHRPA